MKKTLCFLSFLIAFLPSLVSQTTELEFNYTKGITIKQTISKKDPGIIVKIAAKLDTSDTSEKEITISNLTLDNYQKAVFDFLPKDLSIKEKDSIRLYLNEKFLEILTWLFITKDEGPKVGDLIIYKEANIYNRSNRKKLNVQQSNNFNSKNEAIYKNTTITKLTITKVDIEFKNGFIEQIIVTGKMPDTNIVCRFSNLYGIGFSTPKNYRTLFRSRLRSEQPIESNEIKYYSTYLKLSDVLKYHYKLEKDGKDYSPENKVVEVTPHTPTTLFRPKSRDLISGTVFTDFRGLQNERPNGLVETEFSKLIPFYTMRGIFVWSGFNTSFGIFQHFKPLVVWSKIEENNRDLLLESNGPDQVDPSGNLIKSERFTTPLKALNHQILGLGGDLNLVYLDMRSLKSELLLNYAFRYRTLRLIDSLSTINPLDSSSAIRNGLTQVIKGEGLSHAIEATWRLVPEERYGVHLTCGLQHFNLFNNNFKLKPIEEGQNYFKEKNGRFIWSLELGAYLKTSNTNDNKLFLRWRMNWEQGNTFHNFTQLQFGYTIPFVVPNKK